MPECLLVQHLRRISQRKIATDSMVTNISLAAIGIVDDIRETKISERNINYLVDLFPAIYERDDTDLLRRHLETSEADCLICAAIKTRLANGASLVVA